MKLGFSSLACPDWDLDTIIEQASAMGYDGVELDGLQGQTHLPAIPTLSNDPSAVANRFRDAELELVCLGTDCCLHHPNRKQLDHEKTNVRAFIELASALHCPSVRVFGNQGTLNGNRDAALMRVADTLSDLAHIAAAHQTTILLENKGPFATSREIWFILDAVNHPSVRCCWNPLNARMAGEPMGLSIPKLARKIALTHVCDANFKEDGSIDHYLIPGNGTMDIDHYIAILAGVAYQGYLMFQWSQRQTPTSAEPNEVLPAVLANMKTILDAFANEPDLSAYKGDKNPAKFAAPSIRQLMRT